MKSGILGENQEGPFDDSTFSDLAKSGELSGETKVACATRFKGWRLASSIPVLMTKINAGKTHRKLAKQEAADDRRNLAIEKKRQKLEVATQKKLSKIPAPQQQIAPPPMAMPIQQQPQVVVINNQNQSNALPIVLNVLIWPGLGQLVQGRVLAGLLLMFSWVVSAVLCLVLIGIVLLPIVWLVALIDSALYRRP